MVYSSTHSMSRWLYGDKASEVRMYCLLCPRVPCRRPLLLLIPFTFPVKGSAQCTVSLCWLADS